MRGNTNRVLPLLRQRRIVDDQIPSFVPNQAVGLLQKNRLEWRTVPHPGGNEMMKLVVADVASSRGHRLDALAVTGTDQACDIGRTYPHPGLIAQRRQKRPQPDLQIAAPILCHRQPP